MLLPWNNQVSKTNVRIYYLNKLSRITRTAWGSHRESARLLRFFFFFNLFTQLGNGDGNVVFF
jgi:hypothetical protein